MTLKRFLILGVAGVLLSAIWNALRAPQLGGVFEGEPFLVMGDPDTAWTLDISIGEPGTSGNWRTVRLYGEGRTLLETIWPAIEARTWVRLETDPPDPMWWVTWHIQGVVRSASALP